jgi:hypothetical protein
MSISRTHACVIMCAGLSQTTTLVYDAAAAQDFKRVCMCRNEGCAGSAERYAPLSSCLSSLACRVHHRSEMLHDTLCHYATLALLQAAYTHSTATCRMLIIKAYMHTYVNLHYYTFTGYSTFAHNIVYIHMHM